MTHITITVKKDNMTGTLVSHVSLSSPQIINTLIFEIIIILLLFPIFLPLKYAFLDNNLLHIEELSSKHKSSCVRKG